MKIFILLFVVIGVTYFNRKDAQQTYTIEIIVEDLRNSTGVVQFALYNQEGSIPDEKYKHYYVKKNSCYCQ